jgi:predicted ATPase
MPFIYSFGFKNIKVFENEANFELAPITVFTGTNSSGKSTVSEALRMIINHFKNIELRSSNKIPNEMFIRDLELHSLDKRTGVLQNILNLDSNESKIKLSFPINLLNYRHKCSWSLEYEIIGDKVKNGVLSLFKIIDIDNNITLYEISKNEKNNYFIQVNYLAFYKNYISILDDIKTLQIFKEDETKLSQKEFDDLKYRLIGDFENSEIDAEINNDDILQLSVSDNFFEFHENNFADFKSMINKEKKILDNGLYKMFEEDGIFDTSNLFPKDKRNEYIDFIIQIHKDAGIEIDNDLSLDNIFLSKLSKIKFEVNRISKQDPQDGFINIDNQILSPNGNLYDLLLNEYGALLTYANKSKPGLLHKLPMHKHKNKTISITDKGEYFFNTIIANDIKNGINNIINLHKSTYALGGNRIPSNERFFDLGINGLLSDMLSFYSENGNNKSTKTMEFLNKWISAFKIGDKIDFEINENQCRIFLYKNKRKINLSDEGFGYNKLLPIILSIGFIYNKNVDNFFNQIYPSVVFIEEPETGLHPALQSKLADMFFEAYKEFNIQFVIETHSEYLIRKLQVLTANPDHPMTPQDSQLYYFYHPNDIPEGDTQFYSINIDKDGVLSSNFGSGFFDETSNLNIALYLKSKVSNN